MQEKGVTQEDALNDTGIHFVRIEQAKRDVPFSTIYKICEYFEISLEVFLRIDFINKNLITCAIQKSYNLKA